MQHASPATTELPSFQQAIATNGWAVTAPMFDAATIAGLRDDIAPLVQAGRGGARNLLDEPRVAALAAAPPLRQLAVAILGTGCFAVRALFFDKTPDANWKVIWHQDLTIAARVRPPTRRMVESFTSSMRPNPWRRRSSGIVRLHKL